MGVRIEVGGGVEEFIHIRSWKEVSKTSVAVTVKAVTVKAVTVKAVTVKAVTVISGCYMALAEEEHCTPAAAVCE